MKEEKSSREITCNSIDKIREISLVSVCRGVVLIWNRLPVNDGSTPFSNPPPSQLPTLFNFWHARIEGCNLENDSGPGFDSHLGRWSTGQSEIFFSCSFRANWRRWHPVCIVETRVMKKKKGERGARFSLGKKGVNISTRISLAPENSLRKIGHIDQTGSYPATDGPYVRRAFELVTFNWRSWWQLARKLISFKAQWVRGVAPALRSLKSADYELLRRVWQTVTAAQYIAMPDIIFFHVFQSYYSLQRGCAFNNVNVKMKTYKIYRNFGNTYYS